MESYIYCINKFQTLTDVIVKGKRKGNPILNRIDELDKFYTTEMFSGTTHGYQLNLLDDPMVKTGADVVSYVGSRIPGLKIATNPIGEKYFIVEEFVGLAIIKPVEVPVFLDEVEYSNVGALDIGQIAYIKYIPGIVIGSSFRSSVGAVYLYSKKGNEKGPLVKGLPFVYIKGYDLQKKFAIPDYNDKDLLRVSDLRSVLYWNPNIVLDKVNNKVKIEYNNNDVSKKLLLTLEGVDERGRLVYIEKIIE